MPDSAINWSDEIAASHSWLSRIVQARTGNQHVTDDVIQDLSVAAVNWPGKLTGPQAVNRWLYAAAVKKSLQYIRSRTREQRKLRSLAELRGADDHCGSSADIRRLHSAEDRQMVQAALQKVTARQREVLYLKYYQGWSCRQIASHFNLAHTTVQKHLVQARKRLRTELLRLSTHWNES